MAIGLVRVCGRMAKTFAQRLQYHRPGGDIHLVIQMNRDSESPRGTVVIVFTFGALVVVGWLLLFFGVFVPRGLP